MVVLPIRYMGDPVLRGKAAEITDIDDTLEQLIGDMIETMYHHHNEGVGLAAPQVGVPLQLIVFDNVEMPYGTDPQVLINPRIIEQEGKSSGSEGCLSVPGITALVERAERVKVAGLDRKGDPVEIEAEGFAARLLQHEIDHLQGVLFVDRVGAIKRKMLVSKWNKLRKEHAG
ncbi:MAG: peptide deformylase [Gemmatimonadota bacterium]|nr:peptide deformylase [Gemmatimonadota bacterium]